MKVLYHVMIYIPYISMNEYRNKVDIYKDKDKEIIYQITNEFELYRI